MLQFRRSVEAEKHQLQELNNRLGQYLSRTMQLEHDNAILITEINKIRQEKTVEWDNQCMAEMRDLRRMAGQLSFEKSRAETEREKLWQEFQMLQLMCCEEQVVCKDIGGELKGCEKQLHKAQQTNGELEERLLQLENEYKFIEDAHRQEMTKLRSQVHSRPIVTQTYHGPPAVSMEEMQHYALSLSEGWTDTLEVYRRKVEDMEESINADQTRLDDLQREKMQYASEFDKLRKEAEKQGQIQIHLEEQLIYMQENFHGDITQYQVIIDQLEREREMLANTMAEKVRDHQQLLQVKIDLGMEVAYYRALIEGDHQQHLQSRGRVIDIKMIPPQQYKPRVFTSTRQDVRKHLDVKYMEPTSSLRRSPVPSQYGRTSPSRVIPISVKGSSYNRNQSPTTRRDMVSFTKSQSASSSSSSTTVKPVAQSTVRKNIDAQKKVVEDRSVRIKEVSQHSAKDSLDHSRGTANTSSPIASPTADPNSVRIVSPPMMSLSRNTEEDSKKKAERHVEREVRGDAFGLQNVKMHAKDGSITATTTSDKMVLDSVSMEELIEKVMKPAGLDRKVCSSSADSKITYHVEKTEKEDGSTKTQIILESKVQEELDMSEDFALEELLSKEVKHVSLEDIKGTATGNMIQNLLSLGLHGGEDMGNKTVNVEIIEEPVEGYSDEEYEVEEKSTPKFSEPSSMFFQIEELENDPHGTIYHESGAEVMKTSITAANYGSNGGSVKVQEDFRDSESPYYSQNQDSQEYFVSTPDGNLSEPEEGGGIASYGHGERPSSGGRMVDDFSDERYYQEGEVSKNRIFVEESDSYRPASDSQYMKDDHSLAQNSYSECIIEEETIRVSPTVQESMLGYLREETLHPKEQLRGALEQLQGTVSGSLKEELALLTRRGSDSPQNISVDRKKVHQSSNNGTTTIVAELKSSTILEDSGQLGEQGDDVSEEQIMAALCSSNLGAEGGYTLDTKEMCWVTSSEGQGVESSTDVTEKHIKLGPSEKSFPFQMDVNNGQGQDPPLKVTHKKRVATVYLESNEDEF
ncbi:synemin-like [Oncorhynchus kisutch]|uniref:Synemin, intermediate filament protein n=1 Tax=Oncorhynchus kisutch TaxID=8019 RepID=A0A8C7M9X6_ONCKI|nr:synemin-like [Oncorhynchus kisutch]